MSIISKESFFMLQPDLLQLLLIGQELLLQEVNSG